MSRPVCPRCQRPQPLCLCACISPLSSRTRVVVLQHTQEARHALNTGRLAVLGLQNSQLLVGECFPDLEAMITAAPRAWLLFPGPEAQPPQPLLYMNELPGNTCEAFENGHDVFVSTCNEGHGAACEAPLLIVPDGTWRKARKIVQANPVLHHLPRVCLDGGEPSRYRVRKTTEPNAVATIEAIVRTLSILEPGNDFSPVLAPFERLIAQQISAMGPEIYQRHHS